MQLLAINSYLKDLIAWFLIGTLGSKVQQVTTCFTTVNYCKNHVKTELEDKYLSITSSFGDEYQLKHVLTNTGVLQQPYCMCTTD